MNTRSGGARGLAREGRLNRVQAAFAPVVDAARTRIAAAFPDALLHSAYLYGSIPRGTARPGSSDLDLLLALRRKPDGEDAIRARELENGLDTDFEQIDGVGVLLVSAESMLSEQERHDGGWFLACLCTPLLGTDLARQLPLYRLTSLLARETNGDLALQLPRWRTRAADGALTDPEACRVLTRGVARKIVRTGFTLVMPRWEGWTSDLGESAEIFGRYYPDRAPQMRRAAGMARGRAGDPAGVTMLIEDLAPWLAAEYKAVHGERSPRS